MCRWKYWVNENKYKIKKALINKLKWVLSNEPNYNQEIRKNLKNAHNK